MKVNSMSKSQKVSTENAKQKKYLGADDSSKLSSEMLTEKVHNRRGQSVSELLETRGFGVQVIFVEGKMYGVLPTDREIWSKVGNGKIKIADNYLILAS